MTSQVRKPNEEKAFSIMMNALKARYGCASIIHEQVDKPDYGMIWKNKRVGIEILGIDNSKIIQSIKSHGKKGVKHLNLIIRRFRIAFLIPSIIKQL